jgi:hypothetical protein
MPIRKVDLNQFAKEMNAIGPRQTERFRKAMYSGLEKSIGMMAQRSPIDTGRYAQSWQMERKEWGALFGNYAPYAAIIENGARPFTPPIGPLLAWAKRVLQDPSQPPDFSPEVWRLAKGVQKKIAARGMEPKHILEKAIPDIIANIKSEYDNANSN